MRLVLFQMSVRACVCVKVRKRIAHFAHETLNLTPARTEVKHSEVFSRRTASFHIQFLFRVGDSRTFMSHSESHRATVLSRLCLKDKFVLLCREEREQEP